MQQQYCLGGFMQQQPQQLIPAMPPPHFPVRPQWKSGQRTDTAEKTKNHSGKGYF